MNGATSRTVHYTGVDLGVGRSLSGLVVGEVALQYRDLIALTAGANTLPAQDDRPLGVNLGVRIGFETIWAVLQGASSVPVFSR